jgi:hypothetical protein
MGEMVRLGASFSFLRRTFIADLGGAAPGPAIRSIRDAAASASRRTDEETRADHANLVRIIHQLDERGDVGQ